MKPKYKLNEDDRKILWYEIRYIEDSITQLEKGRAIDIPHHIDVLKAKHLQLVKTLMSFFEPNYHSVKSSREGA